MTLQTHPDCVALEVYWEQQCSTQLSDAICAYEEDKGVKEKGKWKINYSLETMSSHLSFVCH